MSEKIYRFLLRLYPSRFRSRYGEEALQVFCDRLRDERGPLKKARLWVDVLRDLMVSAPREHSRVPARPAQTASGVPLFQVLEEESLRPDMFLLGTVLALLAVGAFVYLMTHGGNRVVFPFQIQEPMRSATAPAVGGIDGHEQPAPDEEDAKAPPVLVSAEERALVIRRVVDAVEKVDPDPIEARGVATFLQQQENAGAYERLPQGPMFARVLTREINDATQRVAVSVLCGQQPVPDSSIWIKPARPGSRAWLRIDDHFSVVVEPARRGPPSTLSAGRE